MPQFFIPDESYNDILKSNNDNYIKPIEQVRALTYRDGLVALQSKNEERNSKYSMIVQSYNPKPKKPILVKSDTSNNYIFSYIKGSEAILSPNTYIGSSKVRRNLRDIHALVVDLDLTGDSVWETLKTKILDGSILAPSWITFSGTGLHLYYKLKRPVSVFKRPLAEKALADLQHALNDYIHEDITYTLDLDTHRKPSHLPLSQGYRVVGSLTKNGRVCKGFSVSGITHCGYDAETLADFSCYILNKEDVESIEQGEKYAVECIISEKYVSLSNKFSDNPLDFKLNENKVRKKLWNRLYYPVLREIKQQIKDNAIEIGTRYFKLSALVIAGKKCGVPYDIIKKDLETLRNDFVAITSEDSFDKKVIRDLMQWYFSKDTYKARYKRICSYLGIEKFRDWDSESTKEWKRELRGSIKRTPHNLEQIKDLASRGLSQLEISKSTGVSQSYISKILSNGENRETRLRNHLFSHTTVFSRSRNTKLTLDILAKTVGKAKNTIRKYYKEFKAKTILELSSMLRDKMFADNKYEFLSVFKRNFLVGAKDTIKTKAKSTQPKKSNTVLYVKRVLYESEEDLRLDKEIIVDV